MTPQKYILYMSSLGLKVLSFNDLIAQLHLTVTWMMYFFQLSLESLQLRDIKVERISLAINSKPVIYVTVSTLKALLLIE